MPLVRKVRAGGTLGEEKQGGTRLLQLAAGSYERKTASVEIRC